MPLISLPRVAKPHWAAMLTCHCRECRRWKRNARFSIVRFLCLPTACGKCAAASWRRRLTMLSTVSRLKLKIRPHISWRIRTGMAIIWQAMTALYLKNGMVVTAFIHCQENLCMKSISALHLSTTRSRQMLIGMTCVLVSPALCRTISRCLCLIITLPINSKWLSVSTATILSLSKAIMSGSHCRRRWKCRLSVIICISISATMLSIPMRVPPTLSRWKEWRWALRVAWKGICVRWILIWLIRDLSSRCRWERWKMWLIQITLHCMPSLSLNTGWSVWTSRLTCLSASWIILLTRRLPTARNSISRRHWVWIGSPIIGFRSGCAVERGVRPWTLIWFIRAISWPTTVHLIEVWMIFTILHRRICRLISLISILAVAFL